MTVFDIAQQLMTLFAPEEREIPDCPTYPGRNSAVMLAMNGALQEVFGEGSPWVRIEDRGALLNAAASNVPITVTKGSTAATIASEDWQDWFSGCAIQIEGASVENRIRNNERAVILQLPHDGTTGATTATIRHDSVDLDADVMAVLGPVKSNGLEIPADCDLSQQGGAYLYGDFGWKGPMPENRQRSALRYRIDTWHPDETTQSALRMRFSASPSVGAMVEYSARIVPMVVTDLASADTLPIPLQYVQTVFYPVARMRLTGCAFYRGGGLAEEIGRSYQEALKILGKINPAPNTGIRMVSRL